MKKKLLFGFSLVALIVCLFAISVSASASVTTYDDAPTRETLQMNNDEYVVFSDGFCCPSYYIIPDQTRLEKTDYSYINGKTGKTYTDDDVVEMHVPTGITDMYRRFGDWKIFNNCTIVGVPSTATVASQFGGKSIVTKVYLPDEHTSIPEWGFSGTATLEEIVISENSKLEVICGGAFNGCNSLKYLYLPKGFRHFDNSNGTEPFYNFNPTHENFGFINSPDETTISEVYFFPSTFEYTENFLWGSRVRNYAIVLPETVTAITGKYDLDNAFVTCIVLLSDRVTEVNLWNTTYGSKIYLPNMSSTDMRGDFFQANASEVESTVTDGILSHTSRRGGQQHYYFGVDQKYTMSVWSNPMQKGGVAPFRGISANDHLNAYVEMIEADCTNDSKTITSCVCGYEKAIVVEENTALGHENAFSELVYSDYLCEGYYSYVCERCGVEDNSKTASALFGCLGYSAPENGDGGIVVGYEINSKAIEEYQTITGKTLKYGVFAVAQEKLGDNAIFDETGKAASGVLSTDVTVHGFGLFELKIVGFSDEQKDNKLAMGAYVAVTNGETTTYSYMQDTTRGELAGGYYFVSYNIVVG